MKKVKSSVIKEVGYKKGVLTIIFNNDTTYNYYEVPKDVYKELISAESVGKYFAQKIKFNFAFTKSIL